MFGLIESKRHDSIRCTRVIIIFFAVQRKSKPENEFIFDVFTNTIQDETSNGDQ